jgi:hypothetical protein
LQDDHESIRTEMGKEAGRAKKLEDKISVLLKGYQLRAGKLEKQLLDLHIEIDEAGREVKSFQALKDQVGFGSICVTHNSGGRCWITEPGQDRIAAGSCKD